MVGADGAATLGSVTQFTVQQPVKKLTRIEGTVIIGVSGPVGLGQRFAGEMKKLWVGSRIPKQSFEAMTTIRDAFWPHAEREWKAAESVARTLGQAAAQSAMSSSVVAIPIQREPYLFQFDHQCSPEEATADLPFIAVGSGRTLADPFLAFLKKIFWQNKAPNLSEGTLAALWTLRHAIEMNTGGVSDPVQMMVLESPDGSNRNWRSRELTADDFAEHDQAIAAAEESLANFRDAQKSSTPSDSPPTPV